MQSNDREIVFDMWRDSVVGIFSLHPAQHLPSSTAVALPVALPPLPLPPLTLPLPPLQLPWGQSQLARGSPPALLHLPHGREETVNGRGFVQCEKNSLGTSIQMWQYETPYQRGVIIGAHTMGVTGRYDDTPSNPGAEAEA